MSEHNDALLTEDDFARLGANDIAYLQPFVQEKNSFHAGRGRRSPTWRRA